MDAVRFGLVFILVLLAVVAVWCAFSAAGPRQLLKRLAALKKGPANARRRVMPTLRLNTDASRLDIITGFILPNAEHWRRRLERTGMGWSLGTFGAIALGVALGGVLVAMALHLPTGICWLIGAGAGVIIPRFVVSWAIKKRCNKFLVILPDSIGLMVRGVRSGLPVTEAIVNVGREMPGPVGVEFRKIADQIQLGQALEDVMWQAAARLDIPEFTFMCISFSIQRETGGNLAETLENLEVLLRRRKQMALKIKAFSSEARASSMIIGALPFIMLALLTVVNYTYVETLFITSSGNKLLGAAAGSLTLGVLVLKKLGKFEI
jgi:tight adherence protein B